MNVRDIEDLALTKYEVLQDDDGTWYVNAYFYFVLQDEKYGDTRRSTITQGLASRSQADQVVKHLKALSEAAKKTVRYIIQVERVR